LTTIYRDHSNTGRKISIGIEQGILLNGYSGKHSVTESRIEKHLKSDSYKIDKKKNSIRIISGSFVAGACRTTVAPHKRLINAYPQKDIVSNRLDERIIYFRRRKGVPFYYLKKSFPFDRPGNENRNRVVIVVL
jgi:hypothetical protein